MVGFFSQLKFLLSESIKFKAHWFYYILLFRSDLNPFSSQLHLSNLFMTKEQSNLAIRSSLIMKKFLLRNHFLWPICHLLHKDKSWFDKLRDIPMSENVNSPIFCSNWPIQRFKIRPTSNLINPKRIWYKVLHTIGLTNHIFWLLSSF